MSAINHDTAELWQGWQQRTLRFPRCEDCGTWIHPPRPFCPDCWSDRVVSTPVDGAGRLLTYSLPRLPPGAAQPVVTGVVALDGADGVRLLTRIACPPERVTIGMPLTLDWRDENGTAYPQFRPAGAA
jgi:uncharacterized OB-fold protein